MGLPTHSEEILTDGSWCCGISFAASPARGGRQGRSKNSRQRTMRSVVFSCAVVLSTSVSFGANLFGCLWRSPLPWTVTGLSAGSCLPRQTDKTDRQIDRLEQPGAGRNQEGCVQPIARRVCACQLANVPGICNGTATPPTNGQPLPLSPVRCRAASVHAVRW